MPRFAGSTPRCDVRLDAAQVSRAPRRWVPEPPPHVFARWSRRGSSRIRGSPARTCCRTAYGLCFRGSARVSCGKCRGSGRFARASTVDSRGASGQKRRSCADNAGADDQERQSNACNRSRRHMAHTRWAPQRLQAQMVRACGRQPRLQAARRHVRNALQWMFAPRHDVSAVCSTIADAGSTFLGASSAAVRTVGGRSRWSTARGRRFRTRFCQWWSRFCQW